MDRARACRNSTGSIPGDNECIVNVLRGRASTTQEIGYLCTTYRTMGRTNDAVRCMRDYIRRYPSGTQVPSFQSYIDGNSQ